MDTFYKMWYQTFMNGQVYIIFVTWSRPKFCCTITELLLVNGIAKLILITRLYNLGMYWIHFFTGFRIYPYIKFPVLDLWENQRGSEMYFWLILLFFWGSIQTWGVERHQSRGWEAPEGLRGTRGGLNPQPQTYLALQIPTDNTG